MRAVPPITPADSTSVPCADRVPPAAVVPVSLLMFTAGLILLLRADRYEYFGDELYFLAAGRHLGPGYVDQGPVVALLARAADMLAPGSVLVLRFPAVVAAVVAIALTAAVAREFGGGAYAQLLAAVAYATTPFAVSQAASLSTFALESTCSAAVIWLLVRWVRTHDDRLLPVAAGVAAVGLQIKWLAALVLLGMVAGFLLAGPRGLFGNRALRPAAVAAVATVVPGLVWQAGHGWPQWSMGAVIRAEQQLATGGPAGLLGQQVLQAGVLGTVLLGAGIWAFLRAEEFRRYRFVAVAALVAIVFVLLTGTRPYYTAALLPALFAAGAVAFASRSHRSARRVLLGLAAVSTAAAMALVLMLPLASAPRQPSDSAGQMYARMRVYGTSGWPNLVAVVTRAYRDLPPAVRDRTVVVADSYWQAAALEYFAAADLPPVYSPNRGYAYFGTPPESARNVLYIGPPQRTTGLRGHFRAVVPVAAADDPLGFPGIDRFVVVARCDDPVRPWPETWSRLRSLALDMGIA
ncbi:ArnT family glycosyltransferase [Nocardia sp. NPDC003963]